MQQIFEITDIGKSFVKNPYSFITNKKVKMKVLDSVSFSIYPGDSIALLGRNGSGKTTLLKIIASLIKQDKGKISNFKDKKISIVNSNERSFFWRLSVIENLVFFNQNGDLSKTEIKEKLDLLGLSSHADTLFMNLSSGNKKKLAITRSLLKNPEILLFDEASSSLDINSKKDLSKNILELKNSNIIECLILATHDMDEVKMLANRAMYLSEGKITKNIAINNDQSYDEINSFFSV